MARVLRIKAPEVRALYETLKEKVKNASTK